MKKTINTVLIILGFLFLIYAIFGTLYRPAGVSCKPVNMANPQSRVSVRPFLPGRLFVTCYGHMLSNWDSDHPGCNTAIRDMTKNRNWIFRNFRV